MKNIEKSESLTRAAELLRQAKFVCSRVMGNVSYDEGKSPRADFSGIFFVPEESEKPGHITACGRA
ncbi:MAG: hypothetical protein LBT21_06210 [Oscillospiraceae bacterium]|nr:hypothetical protein [Oscillospiraceae bacterium]